MASRYTPEFQLSLDKVLAIDPSLKSIVDSNTFHAFLAPRSETESSFQYLVRNILSQQVSGAAGNAILKRFLALCRTKAPDEDFPSPETVLKFSAEELRTAGLSMRKAEYSRGLAEAYLRNEMSDELLKSLDDDEVVDKIVSIRGLGPWTAQMFLIFYLHRPDTFSIGDVGVQRGIRRYLKERPHVLREIQQEEFLTPPSPGKSKKAMARISLPEDLKHMERVAAKFSPHRTAFQMILWKLSDIQMNTIEARDAVAEEEQRVRKVSKAKKAGGSEAAANLLTGNVNANDVVAKVEENAAPKVRTLRTRTPRVKTSGAVAAEEPMRPDGQLAKADAGENPAARQRVKRQKVS